MIELSRQRRLLILSICCLSVVMVSLDSTIVNVALPSIQRDLSASIAGVQWIIDAYTLVLASFLLFSGSMADRIGRRRTFAMGLVIFATGSFLCSTATTVSTLITFRVLQALGGSMLNPVALSIIDNTFTAPSGRAKAVGVWSGAVGLSMAAGPILGGALVSSIGWRSIFWINVPVAVGALVLTALFVPGSKSPTPRRFDPLGQLMVIVGLGALLAGIIRLPTAGWVSPHTLGAIVVSLVCIVSLIWYERRHPQPLIELKFFRSAPFSGATIIAVCAFFGLGGFLLLNTLYLQDVRHFSALKAGAYLFPMALAMLIAGPLAGRVVAGRGPRTPLVCGGVCVLAAATLFATRGSGTGDVVLLTGYALIGAGLGMLNAAITNTALAGMPRSQAGVAAATTSTGRQIGQALGVAVVGSILAAGTMGMSSFGDDWRRSWWVLAVGSLLVIACALITTSKWAKQTADRLNRQIEGEDTRMTKSARKVRGRVQET